MLQGFSLRKRIIAAMIAGTLCVTAVLSGCGNANKDSDNKAGGNTGVTSSERTEASDGSETSKGELILPEEPVSAEDVVAQSDHYVISRAITSYLFNSYYLNYRDYAVYQGLDATKSLKEQYYSQDQGVTWFDYFMSMTTQYLEQLLTLCEAAYDSGITMEDSDMVSVEVSMKSIRDAADVAGKDLDTYISEAFGEGVTEKGILDYLKLTALANKYYNRVKDGFKYSEEDYEKYYQENKASYSYADFRRFNFAFGGDNAEASEDEKVVQDRKEKAKAYAEDLAKCKTEKEFLDYIKKFLTEHPEQISGESTTPLQGEELAEAVEKAAEETLYNQYAYEVTSEAGKWIFHLARNDLDTTVIENANSFTVLMITKSTYRDESISKNVRHILITTKSHDDSEEKALAKATEIYNEWKNGEKTEESFAALARKYTEDTGSKATGGLYTNVLPGKTVTEFNDWLFDSKRKPGDVEVVKTAQYGYHIMYYLGDGMPAWKISVDNMLRKTDYEEAYKTIAEKYEVILFNEVIQKINETEPYTESSGGVYQQSQEPSSGA